MVGRCRRRAVTITAFVMPQLAVMRVPVLGPMAVLPMAASAAYLVDLLVSKGEPAKLSPPGPHPIPTLPKGDVPPPGRAAEEQSGGGAAGRQGEVAGGSSAGPLHTPSQGGLHARPVQRDSFTGASAPPWQGDAPTSSS